MANTNFLYLSWISCLSKILFIFLMLLKVKFLYSIILIPLLLILYYKVLNKVFGLITLTGCDKVFFSDDPKNTYQILFVLKFKNFNSESMKKFLFSKFINKVQKLRVKLTFSFFEYFWKETFDKKEIENTIIENSINENEINTYIKNEIDKQIDIFSKMPYEFHLLKINNSENGYLIFKINHMFSDGLGVIISLCLLSDNFNIELFPKIVQRMRTPNFIQLAYFYIVSPFYAYKILSNYFKNSKIKVDTYNEKSSEMKTIFALSDKKYKINSFENYRKLQKTSFNEIVLSSFSLSVKEYFSSIKYLTIEMPLGMTGKEKNISNVKLYNNASFGIATIPLISEKNEISKVQKSVRKSMTPEIVFSTKIFNALLGFLLPPKIFEKFYNQLSDKVKFIVVNLPGPNGKLIYDKMICEELMLFPSCGRDMACLCVTSYDNECSYYFSKDENSKLEIDKIGEKFENYLNQYIV